MLNCCQTTLMLALLAVLTPNGFAQHSNDNTRILFMVGEREYKTEQSLRRFFREDLAERGFQATFVTAPSSGAEKNDFAGLSKSLPMADLLFLSVRRRAPSVQQLNAVRRHLKAGNPVVAIRTASHPFDTKGKAPQGHAEWLDFDTEVLGGKYSGHYGDEKCEVVVVSDADSDPILQGVKLGGSRKLYKGVVTSAKATLLLNGRVENGPWEAVAWKNVYGPQAAKVFYTSLGIASDFEQPGFRQMLLNAIRDALGITVDLSDPIQTLETAP
ncbi:MAG: ThuA domain-containing protein [Planctomycetaceae bacterium]|nr:ThuA domain-containing protein [Planctomycetaceae bacterium]